MDDTQNETSQNGKRKTECIEHKRIINHCLNAQKNILEDHIKNLKSRKKYFMNVKFAKRKEMAQNCLIYVHIFDLII